MEVVALVGAWLWEQAVGLIGVALSIGALCKAGSAHSAAIEAKKSVVMRVQLDERQKMIQRISTSLAEAKEVALRRQQNAPQHLNAGKKLPDDIHALRIAADALRTGLPDNFSAARVSEATSAANDLDKAVDEICIPTGQRDGWRDALSALQVIMVSIDQEMRSARDTSLDK